jgi:hypothetical protein
MKWKSNKQDQIAMTKPLTDDEVCEIARQEARAAIAKRFFCEADGVREYQIDLYLAGRDAGVKHGMERAAGIVKAHDPDPHLVNVQKLIDTAIRREIPK